MSTPPFALLQAALLLPAALLPAQDDEPRQLPTRGGERLLRQAYLTMTLAPAGRPGSVTLTYGSRVSSDDELARVTQTSARWHVGGDVWPVLQTSHALRFEVAGADAGESPQLVRDGDSSRFRLDPGRYVVTAQTGRSRRHLVFTPAARVEARGLDASDLDQLLGLGGVYVPAEQLEHDHSIAIPAARLSTHEPGEPTGDLELQVGSISFTTSFRMLASSGLRPEPGTEPHRTPQPGRVQAALASTPTRFELLTLDPTARQEHVDGRPRTDSEHFLGYTVLGRKHLDVLLDADRTTATTLQALLRESALAHTDETVGDCFEPRYGMHFRTQAGTIDLVVSFACEQALVFRGDEQLDTLLVVGTWAPRFAATCRALGLRVAD